MNARPEQIEFVAPLAHRVVVVLFTVLIGGLYFALTTHDADVGFYSDDAVYLLMAQWYSPWAPVTDAEFVAETRQRRYAVAMAAARAGSEYRLFYPLKPVQPEKGNAYRPGSVSGHADAVSQVIVTERERRS